MNRFVACFGALLLLLLLLLLCDDARAQEQQEPEQQEPPAPPPTIIPREEPPPVPPILYAADARGADGLETDLERIVSSEEGSGWFLDSSHFEAIHPAVLQSVCRTSIGGRRTLVRRFDAQLDSLGAAGSDPRALYLASGSKMTSAVEQSLHLTRMRSALVHAMKAECPFWIEPHLNFDGRQTDRNKFTLNAETGGLFQFRFTRGNTTVGGGPSLRVLVGYTFGHIGVLTGVEVAGGPMLREDDSSRLVLNYFPAIPIVIRLRDVNWIYSFEGGALSVIQQNNTDPSFGFRAGLGIGVMALRNRYVIPWAGIAAFYEHYFPGGGRSSAELLRGGLRVGIIFDP